MVDRDHEVRCAPGFWSFVSEIKSFRVSVSNIFLGKNESITLWVQLFMCVYIFTRDLAIFLSQ